MRRSSCGPPASAISSGARRFSACPSSSMGHQVEREDEVRLGLEARREPQRRFGEGDAAAQQVFLEDRLERQIVEGSSARRSTSSYARAAVLRRHARRYSFGFFRLLDRAVNATAGLIATASTSAALVQADRRPRVVSSRIRARSAGFDDTALHQPCDHGIGTLL